MNFHSIEQVRVRDGATLDLSGFAPLRHLPPPESIRSVSTTDPVTITGTQGNDSIYGGGAADVLSGFDGNDRITAGSGGDRLNGGSGSDTLRAGSGADTFAQGADSSAGAGNRDKISDFDVGSDKIDLTLVEHHRTSPSASSATTPSTERQMSFA